MRSLRSLGVVVTGIAAVVVVAASTAWACTQQAPLIGVSPASVQPAGTVTVKGQGLPRSLSGAGVPVQIMWNDRHGPKLAEVLSDSNGLFSATVDIPAAPPQVYSVVAVVNGLQVGRTAVEVSRSPSEPDSPTAFRPSAGSAPERGSVAPRDSAPSSPELATGAAVLGIGLVALLVGSTAISMRRTRRPAARAGGRAAIR